MCVIEIRPERGGADALGCSRALESAVLAWAARQGWPAAHSAVAARRAACVLLPGVPATEAA